jgi:hypothetical protein
MKRTGTICGRALKVKEMEEEKVQESSKRLMLGKHDGSSSGSDCGIATSGLSNSLPPMNMQTVLFLQSAPYILLALMQSDVKSESMNRL